MIDSSMIDAVQLVEIQIENEPPFVPEKFIRIGNVFGKEEKTLPGSRVRYFAFPSKYAVIHFVLGGLEIEGFYRRGVWESGTNDLPRFHVFELLAA